MNNEDDNYDKPIDLTLVGYEGTVGKNGGYIFCPYIPIYFTTKEERIAFHKSLELNSQTGDLHNGSASDLHFDG